MREGIAAPGAPGAIGPYSPAIRAGNLIFLSGQIPLDSTGTLVTGDVGAQTEQVMLNIGVLLKAAGAGFEHVVRTTVFLLDNWASATMWYIFGFFVAPTSAAEAILIISSLLFGKKKY